MPNYCEYEIHVRGKKENCRKFHQIMTDYNLPEHFFRVFQADVTDEYGTDEDYCMEIAGDCAWSVYCCMCEGPFSYAASNGKGVTSLKKESHRLGLDVESWAEERGFEFQEHLRYQNGKCLVNECHDVTWYFYDRSEYSSFEEFLKENELTGYTEDDLDDNDEIIVGAQEWTFANDRSSMNLMKAA